ncbi:hypothetical protein [Corallococcus sp. CA047B]|uniref:hypothetical protein n=1 Tax=Corallococcus sp. CA047B TaxID=2316729 RepID=UPI0011C40946|nr:hypothetical protein [Corallococcus sp. CA047B]
MSEQTPEAPLRVGESVAEAQDWLSRSAAVYFGDGSKVFAAAIGKLVAYRTPHEPDDVAWTLKNLDALADRLARKESLAPNSLKTYLSRARTGLESYVDWSRNPVGWVPKRRVKEKEERRDSASSSVEAIARKKDRQDAVISEAPAQLGPSASLQDEINQALVAIAKWPRLQPYLMPGLITAMDAAKKTGDS